MPRIRSIKPDFFRSHALYAREFRANQGRQPANYLNVRIAFAGLWTVADREGRFYWRAPELKIDCLPYDAVDFEEILSVLSEMPAPFIVRYEVDGEAYGLIPGFLEHQRPHHTEVASTIPTPKSEITGTSPLSHGANPLGREGKGTEGKGKEWNGERPFNGTALSSDHDELLNLKYPIRGENKGRRIGDLDPEYCGWALKNLNQIGSQLRKALTLRMQMKQDECAGPRSKTTQTSGQILSTKK